MGVGNRNTTPINMVHLEHHKHLKHPYKQIEKKNSMFHLFTFGQNLLTLSSCL